MTGIYAVVSIASNALNWFFAPETQARYQLIKVLSDPKKQMVGITAATLLLVAFVIRAAHRISDRAEKEFEKEIGRLCYDLADERQRSLSPEIRGEIEWCRLKPTLWLEDKAHWSGCTVVVGVTFTSVMSVKVALKSFRLVVLVAGVSYESRRASRIKATDWQLREPTEGLLNLVEYLDSSASQGEVFKGYLRFELPSVICRPADDITVEALLIEDYSGLVHKVRHKGDGIIQAPKGGWKMPHRDEM